MSNLKSIDDIIDSSQFNDILSNSQIKYILLGTLIFIICISIYLFIYNNGEYNNKLYTDKLIVKQSLIKGGGRGVFANKDFKKDEIVEICPLISDNSGNLKNSLLGDYVFQDELLEDSDLVVFGLGSIYNHSFNNNINYEQDNKGNMIFTANRDIKKGEELYNNYGEDYWNSR